MAKLKVKQEYLNNEIHYGRDNYSYKVVLNKATQRDLEILKETGKGEFDYIFEVETKTKEK